MNVRTVGVLMVLLPLVSLATASTARAEVANKQYRIQFIEWVEGFLVFETWQFCPGGVFHAVGGVSGEVEITGEYIECGFSLVSLVQLRGGAGSATGISFLNGFLMFALDSSLFWPTGVYPFPPLFPAIGWPYVCPT